MKPSLIETENATVADAFIISQLLRKEDIAEVRAISPGRTLSECVAESIAVSTWTKLAYANNELIAIFGVVEYEHGHSPWMLGTISLDKHPAAVGRVSLAMKAKMLENTSYLFNWVHARHRKAIRWLKWMGFTVEATPSVTGPTGEGFCHFYIGKEYV